MNISVEVNWLEDVQNHVEWDKDAKRILDKICRADLEEEAMNALEDRFYGESPEEGELAEYIADEDGLLQDMCIHEEDLDDMIAEKEGEDDEDF
jgi:hypothetical protein